MAKKNLAVCIPSGRFVDYAFFSSFANSIGQIMLKWNTAIFAASSPLIVENRNELARRVMAFESKSALRFDYVLWLDTDIVFTFEQVQSLISMLEGGKEFVSGVYYNPKGEGIIPVAYHKNKERYAPLSEGELGGTIEVDAVGFGFCAMGAGLLRRSLEKYGNRPFDIRAFADGGIVGEDQIFCERAKELGAKIWLDTSIVVRHAKGFLPR